MINAPSFRTVSNTPDFQMSRCACSVSPHCGERRWNSSSLMAHRSLPVRSWKAFPAWGSRYRCSVHSSHFCTFPVFHSIGSAKASISERECPPSHHHPPPTPAPHSELIHYNGPVTVTQSPARSSFPFLLPFFPRTNFVLPLKLRLNILSTQGNRAFMSP